MQVNWQIDESWDLHTQVSLVGKRERIPGDNRKSLKGYTSVNLGVSYQIPDLGIKLQLLGLNIFNEDIREPSTGTNDNGVTPVNIPNDLPQAGQSIYFKVSKRFL